MNRKKLELDGVHRDEKEFLKKLKEKLSTRYDKLKQSIERDYDGGAAKNQYSTISHGSAVGKAFDLNSQTYEYSIQVKKSKSNLFSPQNLGSKGNSVIAKRTENQDFDYIKPLKSACFDLEVKKAPASSSLKERIKLN